jgi:hypothetical protein
MASDYCAITARLLANNVRNRTDALTQKCHHKWSLVQFTTCVTLRSAMKRVASPPLAPVAFDVDVYAVLDPFEKIERAYRETDVKPERRRPAGMCEIMSSENTSSVRFLVAGGYEKSPDYSWPDPIYVLASTVFSTLLLTLAACWFL